MNEILYTGFTRDTRTLNACLSTRDKEAHVKRYLIFFDYVLILKFKKNTFDTHTLQACSSKRNKGAKLKRNQRSLEFCRMINNVGILF